MNLKDFDNFDISTEELIETGILVETNDNKDSNEVSLPAQGEEPWYVMQVFTKNLFREQTFFLELIQRRHTEGGFGAGNIKALWDGLQAHLATLEQA